MRHIFIVHQLGPNLLILLCTEKGPDCFLITDRFQLLSWLSMPFCTCLSLPPVFFPWNQEVLLNANTKKLQTSFCIWASHAAVLSCVTMSSCLRMTVLARSTWDPPGGGIYWGNLHTFSEVDSNRRHMHIHFGTSSGRVPLRITRKGIPWLGI